MIEILLQKETELPFPEALETVVCEAVKTTLGVLRYEKRYEISVTVCDNAFIQAVNRSERGIDSPTDVLSFPMLYFDNDKRPQITPGDYDGGVLLLGDIVLSVERAQEQAIEYGHSLRREVGFLTVHSMLHLLGYDHMEEEERKEMQEMERIILQAMHLPREKE